VGIGHFRKHHNTLCLSPQILHKHRLQFLLGLTMVPRENKNNAYLKLGGTNKGYYGIFRNCLWGNAQQKAFNQIKVDLARAPILALYDPNKETKVAADPDASSYGLGGVVLQLQPDKSWRPMSFLSRALTPTESRYAQIEKEALALTWACERSWEYITGKSIYVETDHKPLVPLLSTHSLDQLPPRIQRFWMRLM